MKIVFVSYYEPLSFNATSTDITTDMIIQSLISSKYDISLFLFTNNLTEEYKKTVDDRFKKKVENIYYFQSNLGLLKNKYTYFYKLFINFLMPSKIYRKIIKNLKIDSDKNVLLLSHTPFFDSIFFGKEFKKIYKNTKWIQYWSDPLTLSGINPENITLKRVPYKWLENHSLALADEIVYGPKTLYYFQKKLFPQYERKMRGVDLFYIEKENSKNINNSNNNDFLYAGNYFKYTRNIQPLFDAFKELSGDYKLIVYGSGDQENPKCDNIEIKGRITPKELESIEINYKNTICLMNSKCIQIPGKIFYNMNCNQNILVILDGIHKDELKKYLETYDRFVVVNNNVEDIKKGIKIINSKKYNLKKIEEKYSPKKILMDIIDGKRDM